MFEPLSNGSAEKIPQSQRDPLDTVFHRERCFLELGPVQVERRIVRETDRFSGYSQQIAMDFPIVMFIMEDLSRILARGHARDLDGGRARGGDSGPLIRTIRLEKCILGAQFYVNVPTRLHDASHGDFDNGRRGRLRRHDRQETSEDQGAAARMGVHQRGPQSKWLKR